jgi:hypothetical protein
MSAFPIWAWVGFTALIVALLLIDLLVLARGEREISFRQAAGLSVFWIVLALVFGVVVFAVAGPERGGEYLAGYVIEKSLSVDNVFVFALIFSYFAVPVPYQYRVLFWGVVGALVLRAVFIALGAQLYSPRGAAFGALRLDGLRLRDFPDLHGHKDGLPPRRGGPPRAQSDPNGRAACACHDPGLPRREVLRPSGGEALRNTFARGYRCGDDDRRHLRRGLSSGDLCHHLKHLHRLECQRLCGSGLKTALLHAGGHDRALRLPERGPLDRLDLRGREVHDLGSCRQGADLDLAALYRDGRRRIDSGLVVEDSWLAPRNLARRGTLEGGRGAGSLYIPVHPTARKIQFSKVCVGPGQQK